MSAPGPNSTDRKHRRIPEWAKHMTREQVRSWLECVRLKGTTRDYYLLAMMYLFALRTGEVVSLRPEHFDLHRAVLAVPSLKKRRTKHAYQADGQTGRPLIEVPFLGGPQQVAVVRSMLKWAEGRDWIFPGAKNTHMTTRAVRSIVASTLRMAGLSPEYHAHTLRHTAGSILYDATEDLLLVRDFLRHSSVVVTDTYLHRLATSRKAKGALAL